MTAGSVTLDGVCVRRRGRTILKVEDLAIPPGTFVGVIGTNGAGKTTLLKVCTGLIAPSAGRVLIDGQDLRRLSPWKRSTVRKRIGYVPQSAEYNADLPFTLREVVTMGRTGMRPLLRPLNAQDEAIVDHWIDKLGLADRRAQTFRSLSGGQQQKTLIARAMTQDPEILILDEPCANLDFNWKYQISAMIEQLYLEMKVTVLMVSHEISALPPVCRRIALLREGRIVADGGADEVLSAETLRTAYGGHFEVPMIGGRRYTVPARPDAGGPGANVPTV